MREACCCNHASLWRSDTFTLTMVNALRDRSSTPIVKASKPTPMSRDPEDERGWRVQLCAIMTSSPCCSASSKSSRRISHFDTPQALFVHRTHLEHMDTLRRDTCDIKTNVGPMTECRTLLLVVTSNSRTKRTKFIAFCRTRGSLFHG